MPRTRSLAWSELKIGLLTMSAIVIAAVLVFSLSAGKGFFWQRYTLKTRFPNVAGLADGSPVRVAGVQVGTVKRIEFSGNQVDVVFEVNKSTRERITDKSRACLGSISLLGSSAVDISPENTGTPIPEYGYVQSAKSKGQFADVAEQATDTIDELTGMLKDMRAGRGTAGKLLTDDQLYAQLNQFVATAGQLSRELQQGKRHARQAAQGSEVGRGAPGVADEHREHHAEDRRRRGQRREAAERRAARRIALRSHGEPERADGSPQSGRGDGRQARDRSGAVQPPEFGHPAVRSAHDKIERRRGDGGAVAER